MDIRGWASLTSANVAAIRVIRNNRRWVVDSRMRRQRGGVLAYLVH